MIERSSTLTGAALFVAHPGHELRLFGWIGRERPTCMTLTTGSRSGTSKARLAASTRLLAEAGATPSEPFGVVFDRDLYRAVLAGDGESFRRWKAAVSETLRKARPKRLVIDAWQLYSVSHDLAHLIGRLAAAEASGHLGEPIEVLQYDVVPPALGGDVPVTVCAETIDLTQVEWTRKRAAIECYPDIGLELMEIRQIEGENRSRTESLFRLPALEQLLTPPREPPISRPMPAGRSLTRPSSLPRLKGTSTTSHG